MTDLAEVAAKNKQNLNPANATQADPDSQKRVPMSMPQQRLAVPSIAGYHLYWMKGTPERLAQAQRAGFEFVDENEVEVNDSTLGGVASNRGSTDLGSRVSMIAGGMSSDNQPLRLYLMKQKLEWYNEDRKILEDRNDSVAEALTSGYRQGIVGGKAPGELGDDFGTRYVDKNRTKIPAMFQKRR